MTIDAPDWQRIVTTVVAAGDVPDAPDWERIVVGPAGVPVGPSSVGLAYFPYLAAGFCGMTWPPYCNTNTSTPTSGDVYFFAWTAMQSTVVNKIAFNFNAAGTGTANENYYGLYDMGNITPATFTLLASTAAGAVDAALHSSGTTKVSLASGVTVVQGNTYAVAFLVNGSAVSLTGAGGSNVFVLNPVGLTFPIASRLAGTAVTLPGSVAYSAVGLITSAFLGFMSNA